MQAVQKRQQVFLKLLPCGSQTGTRGTGIIDGVPLLGGAFRIDPQARISFPGRPGPWGDISAPGEGELNTR